jgi:hypothetical protein
MPFAERFDPQNGDVIYGITSVRGAYLNLLLEARKADAKLDGEDPTRAAEEYAKFLAKNCFIQIDRLNDESGVSYQKHYVAGPDELAQGQQKFTQHFGIAQQKYANKLGDTRFAPAHVFAASGQKLAQEGHAAKNFPKVSGDADAIAQSYNRLYLAIRRACKYGLFYITTQFKHANIHFALDEIDIGEVVKKGVRDKLGDSEVSGGVRAVPITTSELRCCYRHWHKLRTRVFFYDQNGEDATAPWDADKGLWNDYGKRLIDKYLLRLQVAEQKFGSIYQANQTAIAQAQKNALALRDGNEIHQAVMALQGAVDLFPDALRAHG